MGRVAFAAFVRHAAASAAACWFACATAAWPQASPAPDTTVGEFIVTGSHIPQSEGAGVGPLTMIEASELQLAGVTRVEDAINRLPQVTASQSATVNNNATGAATVNLRDLGAQRTLVLIDGKRVAPGDPTLGQIAPDLNFIPDALVDRIEITTGGASAVYGSDAIAGVVNLIMKKDFTGLKVDAQTGFFNHHNGDQAVQAKLAAQAEAAPPGTVNDGLTTEVSLVAGVNSPDGKGNLTAYGGYRRTDAVAESSRDFSACALRASGGIETCSGSQSSTFPAQFVVPDGAAPSGFDDLILDSSGALRAFDPARDGYNYAPYQYFQRRDERYTAGAFARYRLSSAVELYADGMFMDDRTVAQLAPSGLFLSPFTISCANPMLSAAEAASFCTPASLLPGDQAQVFIGRRDVEAGPRQFLLTHRDWRILAGARGEWGAWRYDVSVQHSAVGVGQTDLRDVSLTRAADALDVVRDLAGALVCASGNPGCVPYDIFKPGGVTAAALAYLETPGVATGSTGETVASATLSGQLGRLKSPWATGGLGVALGAEYRRESLGYAPDAELASGDLASNGFAAPAVSGAFEVYELYGEARLPLIEDRGPLLHDLTLEGGYRYSWYSKAGGAATYKLGAVWSPIRDLRLRASFNHAVRAPNVVELFTPQTISALGLSTDPCAGSDPLAVNPFATAANCARTGVTASQYGRIAANPNGYNAVEGGNADLKPEAADTWTVGMVATPRALGHLTVSVDYFDIRVNGVLGQVGADLSIEQCLETGAPFFCRLIHRAPANGACRPGAAGTAERFRPIWWVAMWRR